MGRRSLAEASAAGRWEFRLPLGARLGPLFAVALLAVLSAFLIAVAVLILRLNWTVGLVCAALACFMAGLTGYVGRDLRGRWGLRVVLDADAVTLDLPAGRSLIHRPPAQHLIVPYGDIEAIETRLEAYGSLGMTMMQRAYVLHRRNGALIFLFEERALATVLESAFFYDLVAALAARAGVGVRDLGMVAASGGFLAVWGTHTADWAAPSLPLALQLRLWRHAASTGSIAVMLVVLALLLGL